MTSGLLLLVLSLVVVGASLAYGAGTWKRIGKRIEASDGAMPHGLVGVVGILFGLLVALHSSDISQRASGLRLATEREVSAARSILNFASGVGPAAEPVRNAILEYLQIVTTTERDWLETGSRGDAPGEASIYSLALVTTLFAEQASSTAVIKDLLMRRTDELNNARTERITRMKRSADTPQWFALIAMAMVTQFVAALALSGKRLQLATFLVGYTVVVLVGLLYLAWADRLIGPSRIEEQSAPFEALLTRVQSTSGSVAQGGILERMKNTGTLSIGYRNDQFPFAFEGGDGKPIGYTVDLCRRIVERMGVQRGMQSVRFRWVELNPGNRVAMVANGSVDMECDLSTITAGREGQVSFLDQTFVGSTRIVVNASSRIAAVTDLTGKRLLVVAGSSNVQLATVLNADRRLNMHVVPVKDGPEASRMLEAGTGDAWLSSDVLIFGIIARSSRPNGYKILDESLSPRTYGIMVRRSDTAFSEAANGALRAMVRSGEFEEIYRRWFQSPIGPGGVNFNLPMSDALRGKLEEMRVKP